MSRWLQIPDAPEVRAGTDDYRRIERAIAFLQDHHARQPGLPELAAHLNLSESRTQRLFSRWAGISPKRFLQFLTVENAKRRIQRTNDLLSLSLDSGLSSPGRLHDLFVNMEAMSPGEFKRAAAGVRIRYGVGDTPFGDALIATTGRGICHLSFHDGVGLDRWLVERQREWPLANLVHDPADAAKTLATVFNRTPADTAGGLSLWVGGSNFQVQVWRALLRVPFGGLLSYGQLAGLLGRPGAARSVGSALARNPVAYLIPCHRVLRATGDFGVYHWGTGRKMAICGWEAAAAQRKD
jgi:AraC family transcriptional regulator, regulatory protein of adaptative response / methylated-DNA-[protein]-cysteine methyltransferase